MGLDGIRPIGIALVGLAVAALALGASRQPTQRVGAGRDDGFRLGDGHAVAEVVAQGLTARHDGRALALDAPRARGRIAFTGLRCGPRTSRVLGGSPLIRDGRAEIVRPTSDGTSGVEWYRRQEDGIEQGFTVAQRCDEMLSVVLSLEDLVALPVAGGALLVDPDGGGALNYTHLVATDARRRNLPARMEVRGAEIELVIDARRAQAPISIDPLIWVASAELTAPADDDGQAMDHFGTSVALDGDTAVVGVPADDVGGIEDQGTAFVFERRGSGWFQQARLFAPDGTPGATFGTSVAVHGDTIVVGAPTQATGGIARGAAYVFIRSEGAFRLEATLAASDGAGQSWFGAAVAAETNTTIVGAPRATVNGKLEQGAAYVFERTGSSWSEVAKLVAADGGPGDRFGGAVDLSSDSYAVGADRHDLGGNADQGTVYVFVRSGMTFAEEATISKSGGLSSDGFGRSVAIEADTLVVGCPLCDVAGGADFGSALVFVRSGASWAMQAELTASDGLALDAFGTSVAVSGDTVAVGSPNDDSGTTSDRGSAYVFTRSSTTWNQEAKLLAGTATLVDNGAHTGLSVAIAGDVVIVGSPDDDLSFRIDNWSLDQGSTRIFERSGTMWSTAVTFSSLGESEAAAFGRSVAVSDDHALVGDPLDDHALGTNQGSVYAFARVGTTWSELARLLASDGAPFDRFGTSVAVEGASAIVGAPGADGVEGSDRGAVYFYTWTGTAWAERLVLVPNDAAAGDAFGTSVAVRGDFLLVGAPGADVGGAVDAGAAYVFYRTGTAWAEVARLEAADSASGDRLGSSVALDVDVALVGAPGDDVASAADQGSAYVFIRSGNAWIEQTHLLTTDGAADDGFGTAVALASGVAVVGAPRHDEGGAPDRGAAYVYTFGGGTWGQRARLGASDGVTGDEFGWSVAVSAGTAWVGAPSADAPTYPAEGAVYRFTGSGSLWTQQARLGAGYQQRGVAFGASLAASGATTVVGADAHNLPGTAGTLAYGKARIYDLRATLGTNCVADSDCQSGYCADAVCCDARCGQGSGDCLACSVAEGAAFDGTCDVRANGSICRPSTLACDPAETCNGTEMTCPADVAFCTMPDAGPGPRTGGDGGCACRAAAARPRERDGALPAVVVFGIVAIRAGRRHSRSGAGSRRRP